MCLPKLTSPPPVFSCQLSFVLKGNSHVLGSFLQKEPELGLHIASDFPFLCAAVFLCVFFCACVWIFGLAGEKMPAGVVLSEEGSLLTLFMCKFSSHELF